MKTNYSKNFALFAQTVVPTVKVEVIPAVHHIVTIDVSGSMWGSLESLRTHLKNKLSTLVGENDTVSIIWFSGKGEFGTIFEGVEIRTLTDLSKVHSAIDKWLQPVGLTGFKEPLEEVVSLIGRLKKSKPNHLVNLFFMTDGYDNQWSQKQILDVTAELSNHVDNSVFVEFGWGCNRALMSKMAEVSGGSLLFSERFEQYEVVFDQEIGRKINGGKKVLVKLEQPSTLGYAFAFNEELDNIVSFSISDENTILVPEQIGKIFYFTTNGGEVGGKGQYDTETYVALTTLSQRMLANEIFTVLGAMGDVYLVNRFVNAFSKQDYIDFQSECLAQGKSTLIRFKEGYDRSEVPAEDAFTILDVLAALSYDEGNLIHPRHESFGYQRIGTATKQRDDKVKFEYSAGKEKGYPVSGIVFNEERANVSMRIKYDGFVKLPENSFSTLPEQIKTYIYRNYTIIRDGIVYTRQLPVTLTQDTVDILRNNGVIDDSVVAGQMFVLDLSKIPVINRKMVKSVSAKETFTNVYELEKLKARQKVFKFYRDQVAPKKSEGFSIVFGEEAANWLKEIGITDYNGFNPPSDKAENTDVYMANEFSISIKGLSSLPSVKDVLKKMESGKALTLRESIMADPIKEITTFIDGQDMSDSVVAEATIKTWIETKTKLEIQKTRDLNKAISQSKFAILVGHVWFNDLPAGEGSMTLKIDGNDIIFNAEVTEKEIGCS